MSMSSQLSVSESQAVEPVVNIDILKTVKVRVQGWFFRSKYKTMRLIGINKPLEYGRHHETLRTLHLQITDDNKVETP